jgi:hypothetical protein
MFKTELIDILVLRFIVLSFIEYWDLIFICILVLVICDLHYLFKLSDFIDGLYLPAILSRSFTKKQDFLSLARLLQNNKFKTD